jgi:hypothetical protein
MPLGSAFGTGFQSGSQAVAQGLALKQKEQEQQEKQRIQSLKEHEGRKKSFADLLDKYVKGVYASNPDNAAEKIEQFKLSKELGNQLKMFTTIDQAYGQNPNATTMLFENVLNQPSPAQIAEQKAAEKGAVKEAEAEAVSTGKNFLIDGKIINVSATDKEKIGKIREQGGVEVGKDILQASSVSDLTKPQQTKIQGKIVEIKEEIGRLGEIKETFKPEYQTVWTKLGQKVSGVKEKFGGELDQEETKELTEFSNFKRKSLENINMAIHRLTGAQMSKFEAKRIRQGLPDPGEGIFSGDSPTEFTSKVNSSLESLKSAERRLQFFLENGIEGDIEELSKAYPLSNFAKPEKQKEWKSVGRFKVRQK